MNNSKQISRLDQLREEIGIDAKHLINEIWSEFLQTGKWPIARLLNSRYGRAHVDQVLNQLGTDVVFKQENHQEGSQYQLKIIGVMLTSQGDVTKRLLARYFEYLRKLYLTAPSTTLVTSAEVSEALHISLSDCKLLGLVIQIGFLYGKQMSCAGPGVNDWTAGILDDVEDFPRQGDLSGEVERLIFRNFRVSPAPEVKDKQTAQRTEAIHKITKGEEPAGNLASDPFKRRYQVFVSSTYADLKDERRHVMQALLETKCIPTGMELFPAANDDQWNFIKPVIDDCDYYIIIIAGRYGSIGPDGKSYTEAEYDYAVLKRKSILGFIHSDLENIAMGKSEKTDENRKRLFSFIKKVKGRMCKEWRSPEGLESAIKSSILNAIQFDPKPGWIRASDVASASAVKTLRDSISLPDKPSTPADRLLKLMDIPADISYLERIKDVSDLEASKWKTFERTFQFPLKDLFVLIGERVSTKRPRKTLKMYLQEYLAQQIDLDKLGGDTTKIWCVVNDSIFNAILDHFVAERLIKIVQPPSGLRIKVPYWEITSKGQQKLAELRSADAV